MALVWKDGPPADGPAIETTRRSVGRPQPNTAVLDLRPITVDARTATRVDEQARQDDAKRRRFAESLRHPPGGDPARRLRFAAGAAPTARGFFYRHADMTPELMNLSQEIHDEFGGNHWARRFEYPWVLTVLDAKRGHEVLDAAGGNGLLQVLLARGGAAVTNVDNDAAFFEQAAQWFGELPEYRNVTNKLGDIRELPFVDASFDRVACVSVLEHVPEPELALREMYRVLKPGGRMAVTVDVAPTRRWNHTVDMATLTAWGAEFGFTVPERNEEVVVRVFDEGEPGPDEPKTVPLACYCLLIDKPAAAPMVETVPVVSTVKSGHGDQVPHVVVPGNRPSEREALFDKHYFNGGGKVGGYAHSGYTDFPVHEITAHHVLSRNPESVLEIGCARGYILKRIQDAGVHAVGVEISKHCYMTRACENLFLRDVCVDKLPEAAGRIEGGEPLLKYDLAFSIATFEHIPEQHLPHVLGELKRVTQRGLHGIDFGEKDDGFDKTHCSLKPKEWWRELFDRHGLQSHEIVDKEDLEKPGPGFDWRPIVEGDGKLKLNLGSFTQMFHRGWLNMDIHELQGFAQQHQYRYQRHDLRNGLPFGTASVDCIYSSHVLEHFTYDDGLKILRECRRVLKPDGALRIIVPDMRLLIRSYAADQWDVFSSDPNDRLPPTRLEEFDEINDGCEKAMSPAGKLWSLLNEGHLAGYDAYTLITALTAAGFDAQTVPFRSVGRFADHPGHRQILRETVDPFPCLSLYAAAVPKMV